MLDFLISLGRQLQCDFFIYDYSGYGESTGTPTEANACKDATAAYQVCVCAFCTHEICVCGAYIFMYTCS